MPSFVSVVTRLLLALPLIACRSTGALSLSTKINNAQPPRRFYVLRHGQTDSNAAGILQGSSDVSRLTSKGREQASIIGSVALPSITSSCNQIDTIYTSPLTRARETLDILRESAPSNTLLPSKGSEIVLRNLREIDFYSWENRRKEDIIAKYPQEYAAWTVGDPDGLVVDGCHRPLWEVWERAGEVWREIRSSSSSSPTTSMASAALSTDVTDTNRIISGLETEDGGKGNGDGNDETTATLLVCHGTLGQALLGSAFGLDATIFRRVDFPNCGMAEIVWHEEDEVASVWRWHYPTPTEYGCLRQQLAAEDMTSVEL
mmetsp:Transcript_28497/g.59391  ORF Transcript_28497/g.59391 Transcript_28497/m.59391 type:complete len:317 (+) Transcript_28497:200-1150(+)